MGVPVPASRGRGPDAPALTAARASKPRSFGGRPRAGKTSSWNARISAIPQPSSTRACPQRARGTRSRPDGGDSSRPPAAGWPRSQAPESLYSSLPKPPSTQASTMHRAPSRPLLLGRHRERASSAIISLIASTSMRSRVHVALGRAHSRRVSEPIRAPSREADRQPPLERRSGSLESTVDRRHTRLQRRGGVLRGPAQHVPEDEDGALLRRQMLDGGEERRSMVSFDTTAASGSASVRVPPSRLSG